MNIKKIRVKIRKRNTAINKAILLFVLILFLSNLFLYLHNNNTIIINSFLIGLIRFVVLTATTLFIMSVFLRLTVNRFYKFFEFELEIEQRIFLTKVYSLFVYFIGISIVLYLSGLNISDITLFLGLVATGFALAVRDVIASFFVWLIILTKKPLKIGDIIKFGDETGIVDRIGTYYITLRVFNGFDTNVVRVPNKILLDKNMINYGRGKITEEIRLNFKKIPDDLTSFLKSLKDDFNSDVVFALNTDNKELQLHAVYYTTFKETILVRNTILKKIYNKHLEYFVDKK